MKSFISFVGIVFVSRVFYYHKDIKHKIDNLSRKKSIDKNIQRKINMEYYRKIFIPILVGDDFEVIESRDVNR